MPWMQIQGCSNQLTFSIDIYSSKVLLYALKKQTDCFELNDYYHRQNFNIFQHGAFKCAYFNQT